MANQVDHTAVINDNMFLRIWDAARPLPPGFGPQEPGPATQLTKVFNSKDPRSYYEMSQKFRLLEAHYAWSPEICSAANRYLGGVKEVGSYVRHLREATLRWQQRFPWLSLLSLGLIHGAYYILSKLEKGCLDDATRLVNDINWRCLPLGDYADFFEAHSNHRAPQTKDVNFTGFAEPDFSLDGVIIGAAVGGPLVKGAQWLLGEAASATAFRVLVPSF